MRSRSALIVFFLLIGAAVIWWANPSSDTKPEAPKVKPYNLVKVKVLGARGLVSNETGELLYRYKATKALHSGVDGEVVLEEVELNYYPLDDFGQISAEWLLTAPAGTLSADRQSLLLEAPKDGTVLMKRLDVDPPQIIKAPKMIFRPHDYTAVGDQSITLSAGESNARADAFKLNFSDNTLLLKQNARGHYEP